MSKNTLDISKRTFNRRAASTSTPNVLENVYDASEPASDNQDMPLVSQLPTTVNQLYDELDEFNNNYLSDMSEDDTDDSEDSNIVSFLKIWTHEYNIQKNALSALLKKLKTSRYPNLPADSRTLLRTPTQRVQVSLPPGQYSHIGISKAITYYIKNVLHKPHTVTLDFNIDGVPISRSSSKCFWLILVQCSALDCPSKVFVVGAYHGSSKPSVFSDFLMPFVDEVKQITSNFEYNGCSVIVKIRCIVCDAPARNSCLATKSQNGYFGCGRCTQEGVYLCHRITFPVTNAVKRNDHDYRSKVQSEHHLPGIDSAFLKLDINMITQFPLDYLHTVCLGVVKKMMNMWTSGDLTSRLQSKCVDKISERLIKISKTQPSEFQRKCRSLKELGNFKGCEFRDLILYTLPVITKDIIPADQYNNLLMLHCAMIILVDPVLSNSHHKVAQYLLERFVDSFGRIYGMHHIVYNVHSLVHIVDDVQLYGALDNYSAFPFESYMYQIKRCLHKNNDSLAQLCNRVEEMYSIDLPFDIPKQKVEFKKKMTLADSTEIFEELVLPNVTINTSPRNQWFLTEDNEVFNFEYCKNELVYARKIVSKSEFYKVPISSSHFKIYISNGKLSEVVSFSINKIHKKVFSMSMYGQCVYAPMRHSAF